MQSTLIPGIRNTKADLWGESFLAARAAAADICQHISQCDSSADVHSQPFISGQKEADTARGASHS